MDNFWGSETWGTFNVIAVLLVSLLIANILRRRIPLLRDSLIPASVLGGGVLILIAAVYKWCTGNIMFDTNFFGGKGTATLEMLTYHCLALGFIASTFKPAKGKLTKQRTAEIFNTGVTTVATYLLQGVVGLLITGAAVYFMKDFFGAAGILLPFGFGQGTGQAMNYGNIYESDFGFVNGKSFGLTIAALGFLSAALGGVLHLFILKRKGKLPNRGKENMMVKPEDIQAADEIPMQESMDKLTVQVAFVVLAYLLTYGAMVLLGNLLPGMKAVIYGFNFLLGVIVATLLKVILNWMRKKNWIHREYTNNFLMARISNFFFDLMVVAGIAAIRLSALKDYWGIMLILGIVGLIITYGYNYYVAKILFPHYKQEQFLTMYGMLTGTASTGVILLREIDPNFETPASDNMVYQNFPAIVFGFPIMLLATVAPEHPLWVMGILAGFFVVMNVILFRSKIFKRKKK